MDTKTEAELLAEVRGLADRGQYLEAMDAARKALEQLPKSRDLRYEYALELVRSGALHVGRQWVLDHFAEWELEDPEVGALLARIEKGRAADLPAGPEREATFALAAEGYRRQFDREPEGYTAINAAACYALAGDWEVAQGLARRCLELLDAEPGNYYDAATVAEALVLLENLDGAREAFERAAGLADAGTRSIVSTRKQLRLYARAGVLDDGQAAMLLDSLPVPRVAHFCGQLGRDDGGIGLLDAAAVAVIGAEVRRDIEAERVGAAFGALASGGDLVIAEAMLEAGVELVVVLPVPVERFVEQSVAPAGPHWVERFEKVLARIDRVEVASDTRSDADTPIFRYGTDLAMGMALLRGQRLDAEAVQFAVRDGAPLAAGTGMETLRALRAWRDLGHRTYVYGQDPADAIGPGSEGLPPVHADPAPQLGEQTRRAILFGDFKGFSGLDDVQVVAFVDDVLGGLAKVLERWGEKVLFANTWGDGVFVVTGAVRSAAAIAIELQEAMAALDLEALGLPPELALRMGAHYGPVLEAEDPVLGRRNFFGHHVSRAARLEPVAPPGEIFASRPFSAQLALEDAAGYTAEYVGRIPAAKKFGDWPMYVVKRRGRN